MKTELKVLIEVEALKIEVEGMKQTNAFLLDSKVNYDNSKFYCMTNDFKEMADKMRKLITKYEE